ncbi:MAG: hypothetical protein IKQ91_04265, partial [Oscillospiraceae bacterium]|nr:hypothetical protein [Oscillospiraceae bacterium]
MKAMKTLSLCAALLTAAVSVPVSPVTAFAEGEEAPTSGKCGENLTWNFDTASGTITISGKGAMDNIEYADLAPWADKRDLIKAVVFEDGITA